MTPLPNQLATLAREHPDGDARELARRWVQTIGTEHLIDAIAREIAHYQRSSVRDAERAAFRSKLASGLSQPLDLEPFRQLLGSRFALGDGFRVAWGRATVEQHWQRIEMLRKIRAGIDATIERHVAAIELIEKHGVTCLADIEEAA